MWKHAYKTAYKPIKNTELGRVVGGVSPSSLVIILDCSIVEIVHKNASRSLQRIHCNLQVQIRSFRVS